ncbi:MAG: aminotransferase class I/II-fold pyridoxal phosphate-dependent enzyme [Gemmatimonadetes bacterium]|nr:aminotransferase class I/II-fold pyridoxal phosphate-dependent enzyme [Gemmatimonadota bacterium]
MGIGIGIGAVPHPDPDPYPDPDESMIDLRSDTVTRPTPEMRAVMARAEVGDDARGEDPTVRALEHRVAQLLGKEAALFFPSGIMANEAALLLLAPPATEVVVEDTSHIIDWEDGAPAHWASVQLRAVPAPGGMLTAELIAAAIRPPSRYQIRTSLICVENTHNAAGGRVLPVENLRGIGELARARGLPVHLDGARLWNAAAATALPEADLAADVDTVMVSLSKGLGCPAGSLLAGPAELIQTARRIRRRLGGAMRQVGILAAAGFFALEHHRARLVDDHRRARLLADLARVIDGVDVVEPETNIVMLDLQRPDLDAATVARELARRDVLLEEFTPRRLRAVTHLDVDDDAIHQAAAALAEVFRR